jgi:hypothetical protein
MTEHGIERCPVCGHRCELLPEDDNWEERVCCQSSLCGYSIESGDTSLAKHNHLARGIRLLLLCPPNGVPGRWARRLSDIIARVRELADEVKKSKEPVEEPKPEKNLGVLPPCCRCGEPPGLAMWHVRGGGYVCPSCMEEPESEPDEAPPPEPSLREFLEQFRWWLLGEGEYGVGGEIADQRWARWLDAHGVRGE